MQFVDADSLSHVFLVGSMVVVFVLGFLIGHYEIKLSKSSRIIQFGVFAILVIIIGYFSFIYLSNSSMSIDVEVLLLIDEILFVIGYVFSFCIWKFRRKSGSG